MAPDGEQIVKEFICHGEELGLYSEVYGYTGVLGRAMAQFDLVTYKNWSLIRSRELGRQISPNGI